MNAAEDTRQPLPRFIARHRITMTAELTDRNPHMDANAMPAGSMHWKVTLRCHGRQLTTYFSQGPAICREPTARDVLGCLASDAGSFENTSDFEDWAKDFGYDTDSRKAERTFKAIERQSLALRRLLGAAYEELVWRTEQD